MALLSGSSEGDCLVVIGDDVASRQDLSDRPVRETVALLLGRDPSPGRLRGDILMPIEDDLRPEGRMPGHLDREVAPGGVQDVEGIVIPTLVNLA